MSPKASSAPLASSSPQASSPLAGSSTQATTAPQATQASSPLASSDPQDSNNSLASSSFVPSSSPEILEPWLDSPDDKWIFDLLARDAWPQGTTCDACANLSLLFTTGSRRPKRPSWMVSKNAVQHHEKFRELAESSRTCGLCALLLSCFKGFSWQHLFSLLKKERESAIERESALRGDHHIDYRYLPPENEIYEMVEVCYGSGKLVSELRITIHASEWGLHSGLRRNSFHIDDVLRVYAERGVYSDVTSR